MSKTKFTKVAVEDRLPSEQGAYIVIFKDNKVGKFNFWNEEGFKDSWNEHVGFWFEESPDREYEMIEMLEKLIYAFEGDELESYQQSRINDAKSLLQSLKQER